MIKLQVVRIANNKEKEYCIGRLYVNGTYFCDTCEDVVREKWEEKVAGKTAIPSGTYSVMITTSVRFKKRLPEILKVPNFTGVRIHSGNTATDSEGCILVGENKIKGGVINSRRKMAELMEVLDKRTPVMIRLEIRDGF